MHNILIGVLLAFPTNVQAAESPTIPQLIEKYSSEYSVDPKIITNIINCESSGDKNAVGDHGESFGLSQIHLPDHPAISKENALDPDFAVKYLAHNLKLGKGKLWSCYKILYHK